MRHDLHLDSGLLRELLRERRVALMSAADRIADERDRLPAVLRLDRRRVGDTRRRRRGCGTRLSLAPGATRRCCGDAHRDEQNDKSQPCHDNPCTMFHKLVLSLKYMATTATQERALLNSRTRPRTLRLLSPPSRILAKDTTRRKSDVPDRGVRRGGIG